MATKNLNDLAVDMMKVYDELRAGTIDLEKAKALSKVATSVINTGRIMLDYQMWQNPKNAENKKGIVLLDQQA